MSQEPDVWAKGITHLESVTFMGSVEGLYFITVILHTLTLPSSFGKGGPNSEYSISNINMKNMI
jgi:hypothetical protein